MPIRPRPRAETTGPAVPRVRCRMGLSPSGEKVMFDNYYCIGQYLAIGSASVCGMTRAADPLTAQVISLFARVTERYTREYEAAAAQHGLTPQQVKALLALDEQPLPMRRVAERLGA